LGVEEGDGERLKEAVKAYREALDGLDRKLAPLDWAMTQNNLGKALEALDESETGTGSGTGLLYQAVAAYQAALEERCRDLAPSSWATTNANLGNALVEIAERENNNAMLEDAASAYRDALKARPAEDSPFDTAKININLAYTLGALWNRTVCWPRQSMRSRRHSASSSRLACGSIFPRRNLRAKQFLPQWAIVRQKPQHHNITTASGFCNYGMPTSRKSNRVIA